MEHEEQDRNLVRLHVALAASFEVRSLLDAAEALLALAASFCNHRRERATRWSVDAESG
jgi:hypothetical protein